MMYKYFDYVNRKYSYITCTLHNKKYTNWNVSIAQNNVK